MTLKLFDDDEGGEEDVSKIEVDEEYARKFEHNKKREDLQRYEELKKKGLIEEDSDVSDESEDSDADDEYAEVGVSRSEDLEFLDALIKVRNQDPALKNKDVKLFESDKSEEETEGVGKGKAEASQKKKPVYLKDVVAKHLIEEGPEFEGEEENEEKKNDKKPRTYYEEQEDLRKALLDAVQEAELEDDGDGDILKVKENNEEGADYGDSEQFVRKLDEYFGDDVELDEKNMFLKEFFMKKMWVERDDKGKKPLYDKDELDDLERDEEEIERQEEYETNFRYEENVSDRVMGHSRKVEGSVRKKENTRKEQRKSKEERLKIAEMERQEELKHLKNLKKKEIKERMKKVLTIAGFKEGEECPFRAKDLEGEFNPDEYDQLMKSVFDESYYNAEDSDFGSEENEEKPDFGKEDELLGLPKDWDVIKSGDGFQAAREKTLKQKGFDETNEGNNSHDDSGTDGLENHEEQTELETEESKRKRKRKISLVQRAKEALMDEYYKLDYEDSIGDLKTRFKYAKIKPNRYGLNTEEILAMDDKELNQYVSLKKIAPYRESEWKVHNDKRRQQKMRNKELLLGDKRGNHKYKKKRVRDEVEKSNQSRHDPENLEITKDKKVDGDSAKLSRRAKRRRRQSELKLPHSRLVAYGKVPSGSKSKQKH